MHTFQYVRVFLGHRWRSPSPHIYAQCQILPSRCLMSWMPSTTSLTTTLSWEWVSETTHTHLHTHIQTLVSDLLTYCTGHHLRSVPVSLEGNASQKEHSLQEARHSETWSSGFHCVGYPVGSLLQEPLFNPGVAWCIQCHPVYRLWGSVFVCSAEPSLQKRNFWKTA